MHLVSPPPSMMHNAHACISEQTAETMQEVSKAEAEALRKRKLVNLDTWKTYTLSKGPKFALEKKKAVTDLTHEMLQQ